MILTILMVKHKRKQPVKVAFFAIVKNTALFTNDLLQTSFELMDVMMGLPKVAAFASQWHVKQKQKENKSKENDKLEANLSSEQYVMYGSKMFK